jgi:hypothetical protein
VREGLAADPGRHEHLARVVQREAPPVAGDRDDPHVSRLGARLGAVDQASQADPAPALFGVEAACAVERRDELVVAVEVVERKGERARHVALDRQPV